MTMELEKIYGVTPDNKLVIIKPKGTMKINEERRCQRKPFWEFEPNSLIVHIDTYISGEIEEYHVALDSGNLFEKTAKETIDSEIKKLEAIKELL